MSSFPTVRSDPKLGNSSAATVGRSISDRRPALPGACFETAQVLRRIDPHGGYRRVDDSRDQMPSILTESAGSSMHMTLSAALPYRVVDGMGHSLSIA